MLLHISDIEHCLDLLFAKNHVRLDTVDKHGQENLNIGPGMWGFAAQRFCILFFLPQLNSSPADGYLCVQLLIQQQQSQQSPYLATSSNSSPIV